MQETMKRTISVVANANASLNHNCRKFQTENTDPLRTPLNVEFCNEDIRKVYHELFDASVAEYNEGRSKSHQIRNYYQKVLSSARLHPFYEAIVQIGDKDTMSAVSENGELAARILTEYMQGSDETKGFQERNPWLYVFSAHLHMDESTPHLHIDFVPYADGAARGPKRRVTLTGALANQGIVGGTREEGGLSMWAELEKEQVARIMGRYGIEWEKKHTHDRHLPILEYKKRSCEKDIERLESERRSLEEKNDQLALKSSQLQDEINAMNEKWMSQQNALAELMQEMARKEEAAEKKEEMIRSYVEKLDCIAPLVSEIELSISRYRKGEKILLPQAGIAESARSYREKKASVFVKEILKDYGSLQRSLHEVSHALADMENRYEGEKETVRNLESKIEHLQSENQALTRFLTDYYFLKRGVGKDLSRRLIEEERKKEEERQKEREKSRGHDREVDR